MHETNHFNENFISKFSLRVTKKLQEIIDENSPGVYSHIKNPQDLSHSEAFSMIVRYEGLGNPETIKSLYEETLGRSKESKLSHEEKVSVINYHKNGQVSYDALSLKTEQPLCRDMKVILDGSLFVVEERLGNRWVLERIYANQAVTIKE